VKKIVTYGNCSYCSKDYDGMNMAKHLESCERRKAFYFEILKNNKSGNNNNIIFLLKIYSKYYPEYWMFIECDGKSKLKDIDKLLRDIWLECCGHLSDFTINGKSYENRKDMSISVDDLFQPGMNLDYIYDYGSSTELVISVISDRPGRVISNKKNEKIKLVARNNTLVFKCAKCKKQDASKICTICIHEKDRNKASFCYDCVQHHKCGEEMMLSIVNSPRSGECGYEG